MITALFTTFSVIVLVVLVVLFYNIYKLNTTDIQKYEKRVDGLVLALLAGIGIVIFLANLMLFI